MGCVLIAVGTVLMTMTFLPKSSYLLGLGIGYLLLGIGIGAYATPSTETAIAQVAKERVGVAAGLYKMTSALGAPSASPWRWLCSAPRARAMPPTWLMLAPYRCGSMSPSVSWPVAWCCGSFRRLPSPPPRPPLEYAGGGVSCRPHRRE
ncbi:hypothetical protein O0544_15635 [Edwardsiella anguillarum]|nr:hypothetical protein [Edwardsiella anguillarum]